MDSSKIFEYDDESQKLKLEQKTKESPMMVLGIVGFTIVAGMGLYKFKYRPKTVTASVYLTQLRVISQGVVVGALTAGMVYQMGMELLGKNDENKK